MDEINGTQCARGYAGEERPMTRKPITNLVMLNALVVASAALA